jgi:hypothetical protein
VGSYHKVSVKYLPLYIAEAQFRYNNRHNADIFGDRRRGLLMPKSKTKKKTAKKEPQQPPQKKPKHGGRRFEK